MNTPHILRDFDQVIKNLRTELLSMATQTRHNVGQAIQAVLERNTDIANAVIAADDEIDALEKKIDQLGIDILLRFHPVATDLRFVLSSMKISMNLERMADHATNIAKRARKMSSLLELDEIKLIEPLYALADELLKDAITAYSDGNAALGASLHDRDKNLDKLYKEQTLLISSRLENSNGKSEGLLHVIFIIRSLERIGDLAANIGEDAVYLEIAKDLRHNSDRKI